MREFWVKVECKLMHIFFISVLKDAEKFVLEFILKSKYRKFFINKILS